MALLPSAGGGSVRRRHDDHAEEQFPLQLNQRLTLMVCWIALSSPEALCFLYANDIIMSRA